MTNAWFSGVPDELARLLVDARACADSCESYLASHPDAIHVLAAPVAVAQVLYELIDHPPELVLAAVRLCRELAIGAVRQLDDDAHEVVAALLSVAASAEALLEATA